MQLLILLILLAKTRIIIDYLVSILTVLSGIYCFLIVGVEERGSAVCEYADNDLFAIICLKEKTHGIHH